MQWVVAAIAALILVIALPLLIAWMKSRPSRKGRLHRVGGAFDAGFSVFDPAKARATEIIEMRKEVGHADEGDQGDRYDPPR